jgi:hypothetical protein
MPDPPRRYTSGISLRPAATDQTGRPARIRAAWNRILLNPAFGRWAFAVWLLLIAGLAAAHVVHLQADFPNHSPWSFDYAKYTDEGWYGDAAVRAHLLGHWYVPGDFNPAPAVPLWPALEWVLFCFTGVGIVPARALAISFFFLELLLAYSLLRTRGPRWTALLAVTLIVTSPFLFAFSRLAILEPMLVALMLAALNLAVRLPRMRRPVAVSVAIGGLFGLMMLTKTTALFLAPAIAWAVIVPLWSDRRKALRCAISAVAAATAVFGGWLALIAYAGLWRDYKYFFFINKYDKPTEWYWPLLSLWWSFKGGLWADRLLIPIAGLVVVLLVLAVRTSWSHRIWRDPVFGASALALAGYILFMTLQNHPQARYYAVVALFAFLVLAIGTEALLTAPVEQTRVPWKLAGAAILAAAVVAAGFNAAWTLVYVTHPEYTFVTAARQLTRYIDQHPNGNRLLVSISGDEISMITHLPSLCDDFGTEDLPEKLADYNPGWWATWNDIDPGTLEDLHIHYSLEQVASFRAFDDPDRNVLVLFKLHPLPGGKPREHGPALQVPLPDDKIEISVQ